MSALVAETHPPEDFQLLIVDDSESSRDYLRALLSSRGYQVEAAADGPSALEKIKQGLKADLILLDILMPDEDGFAVYEKLRQLPEAAEVPVIFISGLTDDKSINQGYKLGAVDYIVKPFRVAEVFNRVRTHLRIRAWQEDLRQANLLLQEAAAVFEVSGEGILITDAHGIIRRVNPAFTQITGYQPEEVIGKKTSIFKSGKHNEDFYKNMWSQLRSEGHWEAEIWNRRADGSVFPEWQMIRAIYDDEDNIVGYVAQFTDITNRKLNEAQIRYRSNHDQLTGLVNRAYFKDKINDTIRESERYGDGFALLLIDLDHFKPVNDNFGHPVGDVVLKEVARRVTDCIREIDTAGRLGGDEFVVLLTKTEEMETAGIIAKRILTSLSEPIKVREWTIEIGASIGVAFHPRDGKTERDLVYHADQAMYEAKHRGRNQVCFYDPELFAPGRDRKG